jgi:hypothetical protein
MRRGLACSRRRASSSNRVDGQRDAVGEAEFAPQAGQQHDLLDIDVRAGETQRLHVELVKLAITPLLRALVAEHRTAGPHPLRPLVAEVVFDRRADDARGRFRTQRQPFAVELVLERVHLLLDDVGVLADATHEQRGGLDDRNADVAVAVLREHAPRGVLEMLPQRGFGGEHIVHALDGLQGVGHVDQTIALTAIVLRSGLRCAARGSPP